MVLSNSLLSIIIVVTLSISTTTLTFSMITRNRINISKVLVKKYNINKDRQTYNYLSTLLHYHPLYLAKAVEKNNDNIISYKIEDEIECLEVIKKSKFLARIKSVSSFEEAMLYINDVKDSKASHNCWAYRSLITSRCSDDGEPSGTAGKPILNILEAENIIDTVLVITRYYGGIKLGAGGLIRAYSSSAKLVTMKANKIPYIPNGILEIIISIEYVGELYQIIQKYQNKFKKTKEIYLNQVIDDYNIDNNKDSNTINSKNNDIKSTITNDRICIQLSGPLHEIPTLQMKISDVCKGKEICRILTN